MPRTRKQQPTEAEINKALDAAELAAEIATEEKVKAKRKTAIRKSVAERKLEKEERLPGAPIGYSLTPRERDSLGSKLSHESYPWTRDDFRKGEWVEFPVFKIEGLDSSAVRPGPNGTEYYRLSVNLVDCWVQIGTVARVPAAFYHLYENMRQGAEDLAAFKKNGPKFGPGVHGGPSGLNTWFHHVAYGAWYDINGMMVSPDKYYVMELGVPVPLETGKLIGPGFDWTKAKRT